MKLINVCAVLCGLLLAGGCVHVPPTVAHTHIGHAITAFDGTPDDVGLFVEAESRAQEVLNYADLAVAPGASSAASRDATEKLLDATVSEEYGLRKSMAAAESHVTFAAESDDASDNVKTSAKVFAKGADAVIARCDLIALLSNDVLRTNDAQERQILSQRVRDLAYANVHGGVSATGTPDAPGTMQLRNMLDQMVDRENPPYVTVDRWYLFHLVRLPDCNNCWAWRKWANSSNRGY